jgi:hypothetical protein
MKLSNIRYNAPENKIYLMTCQTGMYLSSGVNYGLLVNMIHEEDPYGTASASIYKTWYTDNLEYSLCASIILATNYNDIFLLIANIVNGGSYNSYILNL